MSRFKDKLGLGNRGQMGGMDLPGVLILLVIAGTVGFVGINVMSTVIDTSRRPENPARD